MPVKNACKSFYFYGRAAVTSSYTNCRAAVAKVDQAVRINGLYRLGQWIPDDEIRCKNARPYALQESYKLIPGGDTHTHNTHTERVKMGIWDFIGSTAESVKRSAPDAATPVMNSCKSFYTNGQAAVAKVDQAVRINGLHRLGQWILDDETRSKNAGLYALQEGYKLIPGWDTHARAHTHYTDIERVKMGIWDFIGSTAESVKRNALDAATQVNKAYKSSYSYSRAAVTCSYTNGWAAVAKVDQAIRINGLHRLGQCIPDDETRSKIGVFMAKFATNAGLYALLEGCKLIPGWDTRTHNTHLELVIMGIWDCISSTAESVKRNTPVSATPVKNVCKGSYSYGHAGATSSYTNGQAAIAKVDQAVRVNGLHRLGQWIPDDEIRSMIGVFTAKLATNAGLYALQEGSKMIPGGVVFSKILTKTMIDVKCENLKLEKLRGPRRS